ncbi:MAG TPA: hypothetical protein VEC14_07340 [Reyranellaceae bacterium]|nr:hypothetical protein [Reyranellaceae bacterium]
MSKLSAILQILAGLFGYARKRQDLVNSPEMQANDRAKTDAKLKDSARTAIEKQDVDEIRRRLSQ